jgi:effector-binding domain-containing protein
MKTYEEIDPVRQAVDVRRSEDSELIGLLYPVKNDDVAGNGYWHYEATVDGYDNGPFETYAQAYAALIEYVEARVSQI